MRKTEIPDVIVERFKQRTLIVSGYGCLNWPGATSAGYGVIASNRLGAFYAHRIAYFAKAGSLTPGLLVRHLCHNKLCCNPEHLVEGTDAENARDREVAAAMVRAYADDETCRL